MSSKIDPLIRPPQRPQTNVPAHTSVRDGPDRRSRSEFGRTVASAAVVLVSVLLLVPVLFSYTSALTGPGSDSLQARTVEWARDNHLGPIVDRVENWYYGRHQAAIGGVPHVSLLPSVPSAAPRPTPVVTPPSGSTAEPVTAPPVTTPGSAPPVLQTPATVPIAGEGDWTPFGPVVNGKVGAFITSVRPDDVHTSSLVDVVNFDPAVFSFRAYPGTKIPRPWDRPDYVEPARQGSLFAAFSGGFRLRDSGGGMILGGAVIKPMVNGIATMSIDKNGVPNIGMWGRDMADSSTIDSARQNLSLIVDNGTVNPELSTDANRKWGFTGPKNKTAVWRSGAGITADGHLIWVGGPGLTIEALAQTLVRAGAIRGMQLEINQEWVQLNTYSTNSSGVTTGKRLMSGMQHTGNRWLTEDTRDFVAVFERG